MTGDLTEELTADRLIVPRIVLGDRARNQTADSFGNCTGDRSSHKASWFLRRSSLAIRQNFRRSAKLFKVGTQTLEL